MKVLLPIVFSVLIFNNAFAEEVIAYFHSDINISNNGQITVVEDIAVNAENQQINRGIYRDFPTQYFGAWLTKKKVDFYVLSVSRNGQPEPFHTEKLSNGIRVYMGSADSFLSRGPHQYQLTYQTAKQLGYFENYDEFYWNVTGTGWAFKITNASVSIKLPGDARNQITDQQAWTGYQGQTEQNFEITNTNDKLGFKTTQTLQPHQGLTIGIQVPKGIFDPHPFDLGAFLIDNIVWLMAILVTLFYLCFYLSAWYRYGRDPEPGVIMARFKPPKNLSPAAVHYIENEGANDKTFTAGLLSLAVKGYIKITQLKKQYRIKLNKGKHTAQLSAGEKALKNKLFSGLRREVVLSKQYNSSVVAAKEKLLSLLKKEYQKKCFVDNRSYVIWGWVISVVCFFCVTFLLYRNIMSFYDLFTLVFACGIFLAIALVFFMAAPIFFGFLLVFIFLINYLDFWLFLVSNQSWLFFTLFLFGLNFLFAYLLRAPTPFGRHIKDQIDGLKLYMEAAEEHRLNMMNPPDKSIEHYEALLPYAVALGLENQWAHKFATTLENQDIKTNTQSNRYQPTWFHSQKNDTSNADFSITKISQSLKRNVAASTVTPSASGGSSSRSYSSRRSGSPNSHSSGSSSGGTSSGSSGGSSGGGGGGGGGGGW